MNSTDDISGFIEGLPTESAQFTHIEEFYVSKNGYTCLYKCERLGKLHVLKALQPEYIGKDFYEKALRKEFSIGFQLDHPHICRTLTWEYVEGLGHCIVMDYIDGTPLSSVIEKGSLTTALAQKIITELCSALDYLHKKQIVHRDLKPSNILITHNGDNVKLIDFSLADADDSLLLKHPAGTRRYLAPEVLEDVPLDCRADIYSLGIIIGEIATLLEDKRLAAISRQCTKRNREHRPTQAMEIVKKMEQSIFPWRILFILFIILLIILLAGLFWQRTWTTSKIPIAIELDSLSFGHIEIIR